MPMLRIIFTLSLLAGLGFAQAQTCVTIKKTYRDVVVDRPAPRPEPEPVRTVVVERPQEKPKRRKKKDRLHLQLGVASNYLYDSNNETGFSPNSERTNLMGEGMIGIRFDHKGRRANVLGLWGTSGFSSPQTVALLLNEQNLPFEVDMSGSSFRFQEVEAGFLFKEWFRLSGGVGTQELRSVSGENIEFDYYKFTTGLSLRITRSIKWNTYASFLMSEGSDNISFRPSTGLSFRFNFLNI